jgi:hypothetical protein
MKNWGWRHFVKKYRSAKHLPFTPITGANRSGPLRNADTMSTLPTAIKEIRMPVYTLKKPFIQFYQKAKAEGANLQ